MIAQIRTYTINKGMMESWIKIFQNEIMPRVIDSGMEVKLSCINEDNTKFIWVRCFSDKDDLEQKEANFYGSTWWTSNVDRVRSHLAHREIEVIKLI